MKPEKEELYTFREQSRIKHEILKKYLERFAIIVGSWSSGILYVDGFSGPWNTVSSDFKDASFAIALDQLRSARETVKSAFNKDLQIKCIFLESNPDAFQQLESFAEEQKDVEVVALNRDFEIAVPDLVKMIREEKSGFFPFILIDPTGWTGFSMDVIEPLIQIQPSEVLVNFMTSQIQRFIEAEQAGLRKSFQKLYGDDSYEMGIEGLQGREREYAMVSAYAKRLSEVGKFPFLSTTVVLQPTRDRTHFHLIYATRNIKGLEVFKDAERKALRLSQTIRADAKRRARESKTRQSEFFSGSDFPDLNYLAKLQVYFEELAEKEISRMFNSRETVPYDELYATALRFPLVQEKFLKEWLKTNAEPSSAGASLNPKVRSGCFFKILSKRADPK